MENKKIIGLAIMSVVMGTTIATASANGVRGRVAGPAIFSEIIRAEREALRSGDYEGWKSAVENSGQTEILQAINESNFARFSQAFTLCEEGDLEGAEAIIGELEGAELPPCWMRKHLDFTAAERESLQATLANADFESWKGLMQKGGNTEMDKYLTEENFGVIVRAYRLLISGDRAGAMELLDASDIPGMMLLEGAKRPGGEREGAVSDASRHKALVAAYESGDFDAWKALIEARGGGRILEIVNADNFAEFARAKLLQEEGGMAEAKEILDGLGFPFSERKETGRLSGKRTQQG